MQKAYLPALRYPVPQKRSQPKNRSVAVKYCTIGGKGNPTKGELKKRYIYICLCIPRLFQATVRTRPDRTASQFHQRGASTRMRVGETPHEESSGVSSRSKITKSQNHPTNQRINFAHANDRAPRFPAPDSPKVFVQHQSALPLLPHEGRLLRVEGRDGSADVLVAGDEQDSRAPLSANARVDVPGRCTAPPQVRRRPLTSRGTAAAAAVPATATAAVDAALTTLMATRPTRPPPTSHPGTFVAFHFPLWEGELFFGSYFVQPVLGGVVSWRGKY